MLNRVARVTANVTVVVIALSSCSKKKSDSGDDSTTSVKASSIEALNLSGTLDFEVSDSVKGSSSSGLVGLVTEQKSVEACRVRQSIKQSTDMLEGIKATICHLEAESANIPFNTPVLIKISGDEGRNGGEGGPGEGGPGGGANLAGTERLIGVYMDNSDAESVKIYMCGGEKKADLKLDQVFRVLAANDQKSKGEMFLLHEKGEMTFAASAAYDANYTVDGTFAMELKVKFGGTIGGMKNDLSQYLNMQLVKDGVSFIQNADSGKDAGSEKQNAGVARFDEENGQIIFSLDTTHEGQQFKENKRACVGKVGNLVSCSAEKFGKDGDLFTEGSEVPGFLSADFEPTAPSGFDCGAATWTEVSIDMSEAANKEKHGVCEESKDKFETENCWDAGFQGSPNSADIPDREEISGENRDPNQKPLVPPRN